MPTRVVDEIRDFHTFVDDKLKDGRSDWSLEEALDEWRQLHPDAEAAGGDIAAIQEARADMARGDRGVPFADFNREFRARQIFLASHETIVAHSRACSGGCGR